MKSYYKKTKIIATLGPAITQKLWTKEMLKDPKNSGMVELAYKRMEEILLAGANCLRLNFSHGTHDEQLVRIKIAREVAKKLGKNISIMLDTKGPEIRCGKMKSELIEIKANSNLKIYTLQNIVGDENGFFVTDSTETYNMAKDVSVNSLILVDDGKLQLKVKAINVEKGIIDVTSLNTHSIGEKRRINLPNAKYSLPFMSEKDKQDIIFAIKNKLDYIAASFVNDSDNVQKIREILEKNNGSNIQIISKIESTHAVKNIDSIINASDGIMVARGDLALEIPYYDVPYWEKYIIRKCRYIGKPVIVATQMLDSLEKNIQPTRAEVTDVFFAVERGTDSTMLSGESAKGLFPVQAVSTMAAIDRKSELLFDYRRSYYFYFSKTRFARYAKKTAKKIAKKVMPMWDDVAPTFPYDFVVLFSNDKTEINAVSNIRPGATIIVVTDDKNLLTYFGINYGIQTHYVNNLSEAKNNYAKIAKNAVEKFEKTSDKFIVFFNRKFHRISA